MVLRVGVTSGIYYAARDVELHSTVRKLGYTITRGVAAMEIPVDVAHEVTYTEGVDIRHIAKKQYVQLNLHGDLAVPMEIPERGEWRDAQDRIKKSLRSAVFLGAHYIDFHACLNIWLELITYAGRKLSASFVDSEGRFISEILYENKLTREWFVKVKGDNYTIDVFDRDENIRVSTRISVEQDRWQREQTVEQLTKALKPFLKRVIRPAIVRDGVIVREAETVEDNLDDIIQQSLVSRVPRKFGLPDVDKVIKDVNERLREEGVAESSRIRDQIIDKFLEEKFSSSDPKKRRWHSEDHRGAIGLIDGYSIMAHYLYFTQDPLWVAMVNEYKDVLKRYDYKPWHAGDVYDHKKDWLEEAWRKAEATNDRDYKEFFYAAVAGKYLEGHMKTAFKWLYGDFLKKDLPRFTSDKQELEELTAIAKNLIIGLEIPDAREPSHAGLYYLFRPRQIYAVVKTIRKTLSTDKVMMIMDYEHLATQGIDALVESREDAKSKPDFGSLVISCHSNHPNPLHPHYPLELGDIVLYELLYNLRVTGFGKNMVGYMIYERGGGQDPFVHSVDSLRLMKEFLDKNPPVPVKELPLEFFGMKGLTGGDVQRQMQIIRDKAWEPMKDLLEIPDEEWTMLSQTAIRKGKRPEVWKKGEFR